MDFHHQDASDGYEGCDVTAAQLRSMHDAFEVEPPARQTKTERNREIASLRREGLGLDEIGRAYGITREAVRQILLKMGGPSAQDARRARAAAQQQKDDLVTEQLRRYLTDAGPSQAEDVAAGTSLSTDEVKRLWPVDMKAFLLRPSGAQERWTDHAILEALQLAATFDFPLRSTSYDALVATGEVDGPSAMRIMQRFGTWTRACDMAGVEAPKPVRKHYQSKWTDEDILDYVRQYLESRQGNCSFSGYDVWQRQVPGAPSGGILRLRFGSWSDIKRQAIGGRS